MYDELAGSRGLRILAFPCNQFMNQEPGSNADIKEFVRSKYGITFDLFAKIDVNGSGADPLWKWLEMRQGDSSGGYIKWNFAKFIVDRNGQPVARYLPSVAPIDIKPDLARYW